VQYTCHTSSSEIKMLCNSIRLTFKRNINIQGSKQSANVQVVALAKGKSARDGTGHHR
jgi:hypothetical protein